MTQRCPSCSKKKKKKDRLKTNSERRGPISWELDQSSGGGEQGHTHTRTHTHLHNRWKQEVAVKQLLAVLDALEY